MLRILSADKNNAQEVFKPPIFIAKTEKEENGKTVTGLSVQEHCECTVEVASHLCAEFPFLVSKVSKNNLYLGAFLHDVGKISLPFQKKIWHAVNPASVSLDFVDVPHAEISAKTIKYTGNSSQLEYVVGNHHGQITKTYPAASNASEIFGGKDYCEERESFLIEAQKKYGPFQLIEKKSYTRILSGFVTVCDWISSSITKKQYESYSNIAKEAVIKSGIGPLKVKDSLSFSDIFGFEPNSMQKEFIKTVNVPGVYILESQMGSGKTEAALYAAYRLIESGMASGLYFAMPTCLTSLMIYKRTREMLLKASLIQNSQIQLVFDGSIFYKDDLVDDEDRSWFDSKKRALLAPAGIGTIDQALMSIINAKHSDVRLLGLSGKVVILDEVHSYDFYTSKLITQLVETLQEVGCTIIILSATLTEQTKKNLLFGKSDDISLNGNYPLLSGVVELKGEKELLEKNITETDSYDVTLHHCEKLEDAYQEALDAANSGQYVLWIENSVAEAQQSFRILSARSREHGVETGLIHSAFTKVDRTVKESYWTSLYGKDAKRYESGHGKILVGTQVLEQSLDIDADLLITHICPIDMLLQRIGRLYRHKKFNAFRKSDKPVCCVVGPLYNNLSDPLRDYDVSGLIYEPYLLARTSMVMDELTEIRIPSDIRKLINKTYSEEHDNPLLYKARNKLKQDSEKMSRLADFATNSILGSVSDAFTRYTEFETTDVLLLSAIESDYIKTFDGTIVKLTNRQNMKESALALRNSIVSVRQSLLSAVKPISPFLEGKIKNFVYISSSIKDKIKVALVENGIVHDESGNVISNLFYSSETGFERL